MTDPSEGRPSPMKNPGGSYSSDEEKTRDHPIIPSSSAPPLPLTLPLLAPATHLPMTQPPTSQSGNLGGRPKKKKKAKMGKEAAAGTKVAVVEEQGKKKKKSVSLENLPGRARTCSICQREFATARALFGHMRCHPDRRWRGAHPPPVSPMREAQVEPERLDVEPTRQAEDLASSLLNIGQTILRTEKFKSTDRDQAGRGSSSTAILVTGQGLGVEMGRTKRKEREAEETGVKRYWPSSSSSGDIPKESKKKKTLKTLTDDDQRKQIHYKLDLNKEALADNEDDDNDKNETSDATSSN